MIGCSLSHDPENMCLPVSRLMYEETQSRRNSFLCAFLGLELDRTSKE